MRWLWSKPQPPAPPAPPSVTYDAEALKFFLEHARALAALHEARADAFERKASTLLGFVGVILVLLPMLRTPIAEAHGFRMKVALVGLAVAGALLLTLAAAAAAMVLKPRKVRAPGLGQLRREWTAYFERGELHRAAEDIAGMFVDQLVRGSAPRSPIELLLEDADVRAKWTKRATWLALSGLLTLGGLTAALLVEGGV